jgi:hypothetical protein
VVPRAFRLRFKTAMICAHSLIGSSHGRVGQSAEY